MTGKVALPNNTSWQLFYIEPIEYLNEILLDSLKTALEKKLSYKDLKTLVYKQVAQAHLEYPDAGIFDSEASATIARFFSEYYDSEIYDYMRYYQEEVDSKLFEIDKRFRL